MPIQCMTHERCEWPDCSCSDATKKGRWQVGNTGEQMTPIKTPLETAVTLNGEYGKMHSEGDYERADPAKMQAVLNEHFGPALSVAQPVAQPVVDQKPASMSDNGSCGSQVSGKPVSAEATPAAPMTDYKELYRRMKNVAAGYSNFCEESGLTRRLEKEYEAIEQEARLAAPMPQPEPTSKGAKLLAAINAGTAFADGDAEAAWIAHSEHLNCPACGGSGHVDDVSSQQREPQEAAEPWEDGNGVIRNGVLPDAPQEAGKPAWKCADRLNDCRELCGSSQCFSKEAGKGEPVAVSEKPRRIIPIQSVDVAEEESPKFDADVLAIMLREAGCTSGGVYPSFDKTYWFADDEVLRKLAEALNNL